MSSMYPPWWDKTITIYNKYIDPTTRVITWYKTIIPNCFWKNIGTVSYPDQNAKSLNYEITCRIPKNSKYKSKMEWELGDKSRYFTLSVGDIIVLGHCNLDIDEYSSGAKSNDILLKLKSNCMQIIEFVEDTQRGMMMPHYRVGGK